jgi:TM2 domain-containing membrane protein YozV
MPTDKPKDRGMVLVLAVAGLVLPGLHKFYLQQWGWGIAYLLPGLLFWNASTGMVPRIACLIEVVWFLLLGQTEFDRRFGMASSTPGVGLATTGSAVDPTRVQALADSLRQLDHLRQEGLITEYEFEQQRRQLLG